MIGNLVDEISPVSDTLGVEKEDVVQLVVGVTVFRLKEHLCEKIFTDVTRTSDDENTEPMAIGDEEP